MQNNIQDITWPGWETIKLIGCGSFGAVYEIQRKVFDDVEKAALKVISIPQNDSDIEEMYSDGHDDESITSTFESHLKSIVAEYSLMRKMNGSANIVNCDDIRYIQHDNGMGWDIFIKMELLTPLVKSLPASIPEETVIKIAKDMCAALMLCKQHGIVHRDIKPQNIFVSPYGEYKLGDFGIAKTVEKTMGGTKIGTYKYMAPEVYNNQPYGMGADIYSLGLVLYWLLNERRMPFLPLPPEKIKVGAEEEARNRRFAGEPLPPPAHGNDKLKQIVLKACAYEPTERYGSAEEMLRALNGEEAIMPPAAEKHTICFVDENDTVLSSVLYATGDIITPPVISEKQINGDTYVFDTWTPALSTTATQSATYRVIYKKKEIQPISKPSTVHNSSHKKGIAVVAVLAMIICILGFVWGQKANLEQDSKNTIKDNILQKPTSENTTNSAKPSESQTKVDPCTSGHKWIAATCTTAKKCSVCGKTEGFAEGHDWAEATCTKPATCLKCKATGGKALSHKWLEATCSTPKTCSVCKTTQGSVANHQWMPATKSAPETCKLCGITQGYKLSAQFMWEDWKQHGEIIDTSLVVSMPNWSAFPDSEITVKDSENNKVSISNFNLKWENNVLYISPTMSLAEGVYRFTFKCANGQFAKDVCYGYGDTIYQFSIDPVEYDLNKYCWMHWKTMSYLLQKGNSLVTGEFDLNMSIKNEDHYFGMNYDNSGIPYPTLDAHDFTLIVHKYIAPERYGLIPIDVYTLQHKNWYLASDSSGEVYFTTELDDSCYWYMK